MTNQEKELMIANNNRFVNNIICHVNKNNTAMTIAIGISEDNHLMFLANKKALHKEMAIEILESLLNDIKTDLIKLP